MKQLLLVTLSMSAIFSYGQQTKQADTLDVKTPLTEVVVSASRISESLLQSPVSIQTFTSKQIALTASPSFFDGLQGVQGIQVITPSLGFKVLNARGFANTTNVRFAQLVDGMDVASPHIGGAIGNALGPGDLDIERAEIVPGVASALYGMNTVNGLANFITKNPFTSEGLSVQQQTGVNHLGDDNVSAKLFSETSLRWAKAWHNKFAVKLNAAFTKGYDWIADNYSDLNPKGNVSTGLTGNNNPAFEAVNSYGNESSDRRTITLGGKSYQVSRTGYLEKELVDYSLQNARGDVGLYYKLTPATTISYTGRLAVLNNVYQRANRFRLDDYLIQQHALQFTSKSVTAKVYYNAENTGDSYNLRSMGENIDRNYKPDTRWYSDYTTAFNTAVAGGADVSAAHKQARTAADAGRYQPGTDAYNNTLDKLQQINNWDSGAALKVKASFLNAEAQLNLTEEWLATFSKQTGLEILAGADYRIYFIYPDGNYFINPVAGKVGQDIHYGKVGAYLSLTKSLLNRKLRLGAILRADKNDYFKTNFNPRLSAVYAPDIKNSFRVSYQSGYRYPSIFEAYSNVNSGGVKRVGGLPVMSQGIFENAWLATSITAFQQAVLADINTNGLSKNDAIVKNEGLLKKNTYTYVVPEHVSSFEAGYRGSFFKGKLSANIEGYYSTFRDFIAQVNMNVPKTNNPDSIPFALYDKAQQSQYRMYTNSLTKVHNYGFSAGAIYNMGKGYSIGGNTTYAKLKRTGSNDGLEDGFNTPEWMVNASLNKTNVFRNVDAGVNWRWQTSYNWQSFLITGTTPAYSTLDAQVSYTFPTIHFRIKGGATNLINHYYYSFLGGPSIGGFYYLTLTYGIN